MSTIPASAVMALRNRTNAPMMDCKSALTEANGDLEKAAEILRKRNKAIMDKKGTRETAEGRVAAYVSPDMKLGALIEVRCESAPVAIGEHFAQLANDLARQVADKDPATVQELLAQAYDADSKKTVNERIGEAVGLIRENMRPARFARFTGLVGNYCHFNGTVGAMVQVEGAQADPQLLREVCMHVVALAPLAARREDVPADVVAREMEIARSQAAATGKPPPIVEKIAEGKLKTWYAENVLVEQPFVKDEAKRPVGDVLKAAGLKLVRFVRYRVGELS